MKKRVGNRPAGERSTKTPRPGLTLAPNDWWLPIWATATSINKAVYAEIKRQVFENKVECVFVVIVVDKDRLLDFRDEENNWSDYLKMLDFQSSKILTKEEHASFRIIRNFSSSFDARRWIQWLTSIGAITAISTTNRLHVDEGANFISIPRDIDRIIQADQALREKLIDDNFWAWCMLAVLIDNGFSLSSVVSGYGQWEEFAARLPHLKA